MLFSKLLTAIIDGNEHILTEQNNYDISPKGIIEHLQLTTPVYETSADWGHFGNGFKWDR